MNLYTQPGDEQETPVDGYLVDVVHGGQLIEIQTTNFAAIKTKLTVLLANFPVLLVHPIAQEKWVVQLPLQSDKPLYRRRSPRRGRYEHIFLELIRIPDLIQHSNFSLEILLTKEEEIRRADGKGSWRRKGASIKDRKLIEVFSRRRFFTPDDFRFFLPGGLEEPFTANQLAEELDILPTLTRKMLYCLRMIGIVSISGKQSNAYLYKINPLIEKA